MLNYMIWNVTSAGVEGWQEPVGAVHGHVEQLAPVPGHRPVLGPHQLRQRVAGHQPAAGDTCTGAATFRCNTTDARRG